MKILIIEDEKSLSDNIAAYLRQEDYTCDTADNYWAAMEKIECYNYECILLDIGLPGGSGLSILKELRSNHKMDGVLMISAKNSLEDKISKSAGIFGLSSVSLIISPTQQSCQRISSYLSILNT